MKSNQLLVLFILLVVYALAAFLSYAFFIDQLAAVTGAPLPDLGVSNAVLGLANAGIILVGYGAVGLAGRWFARKLDWPGIYRESGSWREWFLVPLLLGAGCGLALVLGDLIFAPINDLGSFPHPAFPASLLASISAGIGEEIVFRGFVLGLWAWLLTWALKRFNGQEAAFWIANLVAALAFGAGHLPGLMYLLNLSSPGALPPVLLAEILLLNGLVGIAAGLQYRRSGLVAAAGVHFWTDIVWHVLWGVIN